MKKLFILLIGLNLLGLTLSAQIYTPGGLVGANSGSGTNVGIGITNPAQLFHVKGIAVIRDNLGIGTTNPTQMLEIKNGNLLLSNTGTANELRFAMGSNYTAFKAPTQSVNITYTLPLGIGTSNQVLTTDGNLGVLTWTSPATGDITAVGSMTSGDVFANSSADNQWLGLGSTAGRIHFLDQATDIVSILSANVGIGTSTPLQPLDVRGNVFFKDYVGIGAVNPLQPLHVAGISYFEGSVGIGISSPTQRLELKDGNLLLSNSGTANELRFANGSYYTAFKAPTQSVNITYTLPLGIGTSNQVLTTDGNLGVLTWTSPATGDITAVGSMTSGDVFANSSADNQWLGLGSTAGRLQFLHQTIDKVNILDAYVGIGTTAPIAWLTVVSPTYNAIEAFSNNGNTAIVGTSTYAGDNNYTSGVGGFSYHGEYINNGLYGFVAGEYNAEGPMYNYGVYGEAYMTEYGTQYGGYFLAYGTDDNHQFGIYASTGNGRWAGWFDGDVHCVNLQQVSDRKLKENIKDVSGALELIKKLEPREFTFKNSPEFKMLNLPKGENFGFVAQELETVFPELVTDVVHPPQVDKKGKVINEGLSYKVVNYISLIPILTQSIKEQQVIIDNQSIKIEEMEKEINNIKSQLGLKDVLNNAILSPVLNNITEKQTALFQNNPNPFSVETSVEFNIAEKFGTASLCVYNLQGTQLKKYDIQSNGKGKITIHANEYVAGIYLYTLLVDNKEIATKRMILTQ